MGGGAFSSESIGFLNRIIPVSMGKGEVPPLKNYLWRVA
jgi:hypothetical protein